MFLTFAPLLFTSNKPLQNCMGETVNKTVNNHAYFV